MRHAQNVQFRTMPPTRGAVIAAEATFSALRTIYPATADYWIQDSVDVDAKHEYAVLPTLHRPL
jgi:hypothetical protein